jgi:hypothetical protein
MIGPTLRVIRLLIGGTDFTVKWHADGAHDEH